MSDIYRQQREQLVAKNQGHAHLLPETPPQAPQVAPFDLACARRVLGPAANNHCSLLVVIGWGDGSILRWLADDPMLVQKDILMVFLRGEEDAFAASFVRPQLELIAKLRLQMAVVMGEEQARLLASTYFGNHADIPRLAGCEIIDNHPLSAAGEASRKVLSPQIIKALSDRPQAYGNDIGDSFTGLTHACKNARALLPAPTLGELSGFYGNVPIISIAGGPSLTSQIPLLKELQDRCLLVACDSVLHGLLAQGIEPHFVTPIERLPSTVDMVRNAGGCRTVFAGSFVVPPEAVQPFAERTIGVYAWDQLYPWLLPDPGRRVNTGSSTGVFSFAVGSALTTGPVWLVGHDLAREAGNSHWAGSPLSSELWKKAKSTVDDRSSALTGLETRHVPGNNGELVEATVWWDRFRTEIANDVEDLRRGGRTVYNVGGHLRRGALIPGTVAAPLPSPDSLPRLAAPPMPARNPQRLRQWQDRARRLPEDASTFLRHMTRMREEVAATRMQPARDWQIDDLAKKVTLTAEISPGNHAAFFYILRSALHNSSAEWHIRRRRSGSTARYRWEALNTMDSLCHALHNAVTALVPTLEEIVRDHCD